MKLKYTKPVETTGGKIRGYIENDGVAVFKGVPYAEPPVGELRWRPAKHYAYREGVRDCVEFGHSAWQNPLDDFSKLIWTEEFLITNRDYSEDCLTLNLWTAEGGKDMPVILYFYGGGFISGGSSCEIYDGTNFAKNGVIYITFNHREGVLAWLANKDLCAESEKGIAGNYMLSDAIVALEWIQNNIERFGGDPDNVTIWGQSAGASQVNLLSVSPVARHLFSRTLSMGYNSFIMNELKPIAEICKSGEQLERDFGGTLEKMREVPAAEYLPHFYGSVPAVDGYYTDGQFAECIKKGCGADKPFMMGMVAEDGMVIDSVRMLIRSADGEQYRARLKEFFPDTAGEIDKEYPIDETNIRGSLRPLARDLLLKGMLDFAKARSEASPGSVTYMYIFKHVMPGPLSSTFGAFHSFEVPYFNNHFSDLRKDYWTQIDYDLGVTTSAELISYAKTGKPASADFVKSDGSNLFIMDTDGSCNEVISAEKIAELDRLFGKTDL